MEVGAEKGGEDEEVNTFLWRHLPRLITYAVGFPLSYLGFSWLIPISKFTSNDALLMSLIVLWTQAAMDLVIVVTEEINSPN